MTELEKGPMGHSRMVALDAGVHMKTIIRTEDWHTSLYLTVCKLRFKSLMLYKTI